MKHNTTLYIHASNVVGFGARTVAESLLQAMAKAPALKDVSVLLHLPDVAFWRESCPAAENWEITFERRPSGKIQRLWGRTIECLLTPAWLKNASFVVVLGDMPIRFKGKQLVLVHNTHLISSRITGKFKIDFFLLMRLIFRFNVRFADGFVVQSEVVRSELALSYPSIANRIKSIPMPIPQWLRGIKAMSNTESNVFRMFYPANDYPHKNHLLISQMYESRPMMIEPVELKLTLSDEEFSKLTSLVPSPSSWVSFEGSLDKEQMTHRYLTSDAVFFPSVKESYGFPLVEAMSLGIFIICADLPYARWMCADQAIYFDPTDPLSAWAAIDESIKRRKNGWKPDWTDALAKIPIDWDHYTAEFLDEIKIG